MTTPFGIFGEDVKAQFRAMTEEHMPHTCVVRKGTEVKVGSRVTTTYDIANPANFSTPCRMSSLGAIEKERLMGATLSAPSIVQVFFSARTALGLTDRLDIVGVTQTSEGDIGWARSFGVVAIDSPDVAVEVQRRVLAQELG